MLFYTTLFITSLILMFILLWFFRMMATLVRKIHSTQLPNGKQGPTAHLTESKYGKDSKLASKAWGRNAHATPANLARTHPAKADKSAPWGWPGNEHEIREHHPQVAAASGATFNSNPTHKKVRRWKKNSEKFVRSHGTGLSGKAYNPSRDARSTFAIDKKND